MKFLYLLSSTPTSHLNISLVMVALLIFRLLVFEFVVLLIKHCVSVNFIIIWCQVFAANDILFRVMFPITLYAWFLICAKALVDEPST